MDAPLNMTFRGLPARAELKSLIQDKVAGLEKFHDRINSCRVAVEKPHKHQDRGNPYRVRIVVTTPPGKELVATAGQLKNALNDDLETVVNEAFDAMRRQLKELAQRQRDQVKRHDRPEGLVTKLFDDDGYGFLRSVPEGREVYFHRNAVLDGDFDRLEVGTRVRFVEEAGDKGPQASTVQVIGKPGVRRAQVEDAEIEAPEGWGQQE